MWFIIFWLLFGAYGLVENSDIITAVKSKKMKALGMAIIIICTPIRIVCGIFDYILEQIFGEGFDDDDETGTC